jgi:hypothetical protein
MKSILSLKVFSFLCCVNLILIISCSRLRLSKSHGKQSISNSKSSGITKVDSVKDSGLAFPAEENKSDSSLSNDFGKITSAYNKGTSFQEAVGKVQGQTATLGDNTSEISANGDISSRGKHTGAIKTSADNSAGGGGTSSGSGSQIGNLVKQDGKVTNLNSINGTGIAASAVEGAGNSLLSKTNGPGIDSFSKSAAKLNLKIGEGSINTKSEQNNQISQFGNSNLSRESIISLLGSGVGNNNSKTQSKFSQNGSMNRIQNNNTASGQGKIENRNNISNLSNRIGINSIKNENLAEGEIDILNINKLQSGFGCDDILNINQSDGNIKNINIA